MPYITSGLKQMIRQRDYLKAKAVKTGSKILHQAFRQIRGKVHCTLNKLRTEYYTKKLNETKGDTKKKLESYETCHESGYQIQFN